MKKILLSAIIALFITSCSKDDLSTNLTGMKVTEYDNGFPKLTKYHDYSDGKLNAIRIYNAGNFLVDKINYSYYSNGLIFNFGADNTTSPPTAAYGFIYDNDRRLMHKTHGQDIYAYTYNNDNTITANRTGPNPLAITYYLNDEGLIYKEVSEEGEYEITFNGSTPVSIYNGTSTKIFLYDETHDRGLLNDRNKQDQFMANYALRANNIYEARTSTADKYLIEEKNEGQLSSSTTYEYIFNDAGLPTNKKEFDNGELIKETEYIYQ